MPAYITLRPDGMGNDTDLIGSSAISNRNTLIDQSSTDDDDYVYLIKDRGA